MVGTSEKGAAVLDCSPFFRRREFPRYLADTLHLVTPTTEDRCATLLGRYSSGYPGFIGLTWLRVASVGNAAPIESGTGWGGLLPKMRPQRSRSS